MVQFVAADYVVLAVVLAGSLGIGVFYGRKPQDSREYTSGKGKMAVLPVGLSMCVSFVSAITVQASTRNNGTCTCIYSV